MKKDGLDKKAKEVFKMVKQHFIAEYDDTGSIGKRYARADEIGTVAAITIDYQTLEDNTVTIRDRNTTKQIRVSVNEIESVLEKFLEGEELEKLGEVVK